MIITILALNICVTDVLPGVRPLEDGLVDLLRKGLLCHKNIHNSNGAYYSDATSKQHHGKES
jgi:hypothetical protein